MTFAFHIGHLVFSPFIKSEDHTANHFSSYDRFTALQIEPCCPRCRYFLPARRSKRGICYGDVAGWLAGCLSVTRRYCIKTAKPILKLFRPSGSLIILVSSDPCDEQGNTFSGGVKYTGGGKKWRFSCDFRRKSPFIGRWLLWNVNRKS